MAASSLTGREKRIACIACAALLAFIACRVLIVPELRRHRLLSDRLARLRTECLRAHGNLRVRARVEKEREAYAREISKRGSDRLEQSFLLRKLEQLSRESAVRVRGMRPLPPEDVGFYRRYAVSLDTEGPTVNVLRFLHSIQSSPSLLKVEHVQLSAIKGEQRPLVARFRVSRPSVGAATEAVEHPVKESAGGEE